MILQPNLSKAQYRFLAVFFRTLAEAIILGFSAAFFLPEALQLETSIPFLRYMILMFVGLISLAFGAILEKKGEV